METERCGWWGGLCGWREMEGYDGVMVGVGTTNPEQVKVAKAGQGAVQTMLQTY
jgi:hypothetical protein